MTDGLSVSVSHRQGAFRLEAAFTAPRGVTALFGRSGSGKTTLVDAIGGLVRPDRARITLDDRILTDTDARLVVPPHRRRIGYVFQDARLLPHLGVRSNLLYGRLFAPRDAPGPEVDAVIDLLGLAPLLGRRTAGLSGGERQRVAIGRALLAKPALLLMDEPLASLDETRKAEILPFVERLRDEAGVPIVYVSHSLAEVARLADTLVVLEDGRVAAAGLAAAILSRPDLPGLGGLAEAGAVLDAVVTDHDAGWGLTELDTPAGRLLVPHLAVPVGTRRRVQIAARDVLLALDGAAGRTSALNVLAGIVDRVSPADGAAVVVSVRCGGAILLARITARSRDTLALEPGTPVQAMVKSVALAGMAGDEGA